MIKNKIKIQKIILQTIFYFYFFSISPLKTRYITLLVYYVIKNRKYKI